MTSTTIRGVAIAAALLTAIGLMAAQSVQALADPPPVPPGQTTTSASSAADSGARGRSGPSSDRAAIAAAAHVAKSRDPGSIARLAATASSVRPTASTRSNAGLKAQVGKTTITVGNNGRASVSSSGGFALGVSVSSADGTATVLDTAVVQTGVAPDTDVVTSPTDQGVQMVAVLGSAAAPTSVDFTLDLPATAAVVLQADGSVTITDDVAVERPTPADEALLNSQIEAILSGGPANGKITDAQWAAIAALPQPPTRTVMERQQIAGIDAPWAVDANGAAVATHFELTAAGVRQVVDVGPSTAYPVSMDPALWVKIAYPYGYAFALALGASVRSAVYASGGNCRNETAYDLWVCWGGRGNITKLDGYGGGTTYGSTYYFALKDPKSYYGSAYGSTLTHEAAHYTQWIMLGPAFAPSYLAAEGVSRLTTGKAGCGNIYEILAGLKSGHYSC